MSYSASMRGWIGSLAVCAFVASGCSSSSTSGGGAPPSAVTQSIGPEGGTLSVGGATITFPKGALAAATTVTITTNGNPAPDGYVVLSNVFKCEPSGTDFAVPVTMQMPFTDDGKGPATVFWSSGPDPSFRDVGGMVQGTTMTASVKHFSYGFVGRKK
jgi:hypothetical protein